MPAAGVLALLMLLAPSTAGATALGPDGGATTRLARASDSEDCEPTVPQAYSTTPTGNGQTISLDILVLVDGAPKTDTDTTLAGIARIYSPLRVNVVPTFKRWALDPATPTRIAATELIAAARGTLGGQRPAGIDVVHILTNRDLTYGSATITGYADCIGGVRDPARAFSVSKLPSEPRAIGPANFYIDSAVEIAAHEIGHLLGARHEHANCAQGAGADDVTNREPSVCTLMTNYMELQSPSLGLLESLVIRGYAERYAGP